MTLNLFEPPWNQSFVSLIRTLFFRWWNCLTEVRYSVQSNGKVSIRVSFLSGMLRLYPDSASFHWSEILDPILWTLHTWSTLFIVAQALSMVIQLIFQPGHSGTDELIVKMLKHLCVVNGDPSEYSKSNRQVNVWHNRGLLDPVPA